MHGFRAEELVAQLFQALGYEVEREVAVGGIQIDIIAKKDGKASPIEVIASGGVVLDKLRVDAAESLSRISRGTCDAA